MKKNEKFTKLIRISDIIEDIHERSANYFITELRPQYFENFSDIPFFSMVLYLSCAKKEKAG